MKFWKLTLPFLVALGSAVLVWSQGNLGILSGVITDSSGGVIPNVEVVAKHLAQGQEYKARTNHEGRYQVLGLPAGEYEVRVDALGFKRLVQRVAILSGQTRTLSVTLEVGNVSETVMVTAEAPSLQSSTTYSTARRPGRFSLGKAKRAYPPPPPPPAPSITAPPNDEDFGSIQEEGFAEVARKPLSTFSIDVDTAAYAQVRRFLKDGQLPPTDAVRIEELLNYFRYRYPEPTGEHPFAVTTDMTACPWNPQHRIVRVGLKAKDIQTAKLPPANLVFLLDVSGSMDMPNKLPLLKKSFELLTNQLREKDRVAIVVYAGAAGVVLPSTHGADKQRIIAALDRLHAGGSTAGAQGIELAYRVARESFLRGGNNRVILATDGDFNVGISSDSELKKLIERERENGVFLTVLGYGMGNVKDAKMEMLARHGNGNYAYVDSLNEARKVLVEQFGATMFTVAKDVKLQVEFNPARIRSYRLIGYENRRLRDEDFKDDQKDAGDMGAGHTVTALYEVVPASSSPRHADTAVDPLKYQTTVATAPTSPEALTVKLRYKQPAGKVSTEFAQVLEDRLTEPGADLRFALAVAEFGLLLRDSKYKANARYESAAANAAASLGPDEDGRRAEFLYLVKQARTLAAAKLSRR